MTSNRRLNEKRDQGCEAVNAADEQWCLAVLVLHICVDAAANEKLDDFLTIVLTGHVQGCRQLSVDQVSLRSCSLYDQNHHLGMAQLGNSMQH